MKKLLLPFALGLGLVASSAAFAQSVDQAEDRLAAIQEAVNATGARIALANSPGMVRPREKGGTLEVAQAADGADSITHRPAAIGTRIAQIIEERIGHVDHGTIVTRIAQIVVAQTDATGQAASPAEVAKKPAREKPSRITQASDTVEDGVLEFSLRLAQSDDYIEPSNPQDIGLGGTTSA